MKGRANLANTSAASIIAKIFGVLAGLGGLTHGIGEVLQGNVSTEGIWIYSWAQGPIATNMGGEPGITVVPNMLVTGILAIIVSLTLIVWSVVLIQKKRDGLILIVFSIIMLLVGGGVGPPIIGILAGVAGLGIGASFKGWRKCLPARLRHVLALAWPWIFAVTVANGVFLVIGSLILVYFFDVNNPDVFTNSFFFAVILQLLAILTGIAYDIRRAERGATGSR